MHYFKRNIGDYYKKAGRLTMQQHGAYTLLTDACYDREQFPTLEQAIDWAWASNEAEESAVKFVLNKFFTLDDGVYVQKRIQDELENYKKNSATNKRIAIEREAKRKEKSTNRARGVDGDVTDSKQDVNDPTPNHKPRTINQEPLTKNQYKDQIQSVFDYWIQAMNKTGQTKLTNESKKKIRDRLASGYTVLQIQEAIYNCSQSPHNMGFNDRNTQYNDLTLICRDDTKLEYYLNSVNKNQQAQMSSSTQQTLNNLNNMELT